MLPLLSSPLLQQTLYLLDLSLMVVSVYVQAETVHVGWVSAGIEKKFKKYTQIRQSANRTAMKNDKSTAGNTQTVNKTVPSMTCVEVALENIHMSSSPAV